MMTRRGLLGAGAAAAGLAATGARASSRFFVPPEERAHELTLMQWPASRRLYPRRGFRELLQGTIADIASTIAEFEPVALLADADLHADIRRQVSGNVTLWDIPTEDLWCRDSGPIVAIDGTGRRAVQHIRFNGWGDKQIHRHDGQIAARVAERLGLPLLRTPLQGEAGGGIHCATKEVPAP